MEQGRKSEIHKGLTSKPLMITKRKGTPLVRVIQQSKKERKGLIREQGI